MEQTPITVTANISAPLAKVWEYYNDPKHVVNWNNASPDWHSPKAENDLKAGGKFNYRMEAKDGSAGFDFTGTYTEVTPNSLLKYSLDDGRKVSVAMIEENNQTTVTVTFDPESENPAEFQKSGWQAILDDFKEYTEKSNSLIVG